MKKFKNIDELITALKDGSFDVPVHVDRKNKMFIPVFKKIISDERKTGRVFFLSYFCAAFKILRKGYWLNHVYPKERCDNYVKDTKSELLSHADDYKKAYELLCEDSKQLYLDLLCLRLTGDFNYVIPHYNPNPQYLSDKLSWKDRPNIVDAGGYIGDTLISFIDANIIPGYYRIYELDDKNYIKLSGNVKKARKMGIKASAVKKGLYSDNKTLYFVADRDSSRIVDYKTDNNIDVVKLDSDLKFIPDFIKMDIEGSEFEALKGCEKIIKKCAPVLAICIYHLKDDFRSIPLLIKELNPEYKNFWIEHYQLGYNETVMYVSK